MSHRTPRETACLELVEMLTDYLEGALPPDEAAAVESHLAACEGCGTYLDQMRITIRTLGSVPVDSIAPGTMDTLLAAFTRRTD